MNGAAPGVSRGQVHVAGLLLALAAVAWREAARWPWAPLWTLLGGLAAGWLALGWAWRTVRAGGGVLPVGVVLGWAVVARGIGLGAVPTWEDDYFRYLWDGWRTLTAGTPYGAAPADFFGDATVPAEWQRVLDGINHPELATIYGPPVQAVLALAAWIAPTNLAALKALLVACELGALAVVWRLLPAGGALLWAWGPPVILEIAVNGHSEAVALLALAVTVRCAAGNAPVAAVAALAVAGGAKSFLWVLAPFFLVRAGWRGVAAAAGVVAAMYGPFWGRGGATEWATVRGMAALFEFNSTGYAVLAWALGAEAGRAVSGAALVVGVAGLGGRWWRRGGAIAAVPGAEVLAVVFLFSPVVNAWYLLALLPWAARTPRAWAVAALGAVGLAYVHGLNLPGGVMGGYVHPAWVRPAEVLIVAAGAGLSWRAARAKAGWLPD
jgi:hypothetical protein